MSKKTMRQRQRQAIEDAQEQACSWCGGVVAEPIKECDGSIVCGRSCSLDVQRHEEDYQDLMIDVLRREADAEEEERVGQQKEMLERLGDDDQEGWYA